MNLAITSANTVSGKDNLLVLTDSNKLDWAKDYLSPSIATYLKKACEQGVTQLFLPTEKSIVLVQVLKKEKNKSTQREQARKDGNEILEIIERNKIKEVTVINHASSDLTYDYVEGMALGSYQFLKYYKDAENKKNALEKLRVLKSSLSSERLEELKNVVKGTCKARDLINEPLSYLTAEKLSEEAVALGKDANFDVEVLHKDKITTLKMGGLLAVNKGSVDPPTFSILEWKPKNAKNKKPIILVGKGVVYDTGGLSLKPTSNSMDFMKSDMGGAAVVLGTMYAVAKNKLPLHVIGLVPSTDNRPGKNAYVPGDVITMYDGTTVEVLNTDAEGRLILADALHYAKSYQPELVMDFATLTGSAARAVGSQALVYMSNAKESVKKKMEASGMATYERLVEFPTWKEYGEMLKSDIADLRNIGGSNAGAITAGKFLEHFTDYPWIHFDIAGSAFLQSSDSYRGKNGTGVGVRLIFDFLNNY